MGLEMKVVIAGSRIFNDYKYVEKCVDNSGIEISEIISGGAYGVDTLAIRYATKHNIPLTLVEAQWGLYGNAAGPIRNKQMALVCDALIAIKTSGKGTQSMIKEATKLGKVVVCYD